MLVDNAVSCSRTRAHREEGRSRVEAAGSAQRSGTADHRGNPDVGRSVLPDGFISGIAGQLFRDQALTVSFSLLFSLIVAMTLVPMLAAGKPEYEVPDPERSPGPAGRTIGRILYGKQWLTTRVSNFMSWLLGFAARPTQAGFAAVARAYLPALRWSLEHRAASC